MRSWAPPGPDGYGRWVWSLERTDVRGLRATLALGDLELDSLVLVERAVAAGLNRREVREDVVAAVIRGDEAVALSALNHLTVPTAMYFSLPNRTPRRAGSLGNEPATHEPVRCNSGPNARSARGRNPAGAAELSREARSRER